MLGESDDPNTVAQINRQFHLCIVEAARNQFLTHCYNDLSNALIAGKQHWIPNNALITCSQHADIITAFAKARWHRCGECDEEPHGNIADA